MAVFHKRIGAAVMAAAMLASVPALAESKLKIGGIFPLTGELADYGPAAKSGAELAIDEINKAGGVLGSPVSLSIGDD